ncbi:NAD(P)/FAD-dependent oxidoreductase [Streptomyces flavofungini]|uniref:NAD(P)/FAD-dependent oxidoreductase n=1 Tax=Streptomyces flavofungini TaxID=68200 RepID=A0ABS0XGM9_9ACTN|nr:NAD(P)/FAD-dependent oxidoreductase [Streptomyces flavofungini]MBJ3812380.1 NAD(P)/FAD-dependent oxidoreductase [Streptomyces flavofungini]GHC88091.1 hypothetical protein GCM10010349_75100 [Streptomyces flavofungini]
MPDSDVIVFGAGPAASAAALQAARSGLSVIMLDQSGFPGTHLPESWSGRSAALLTWLGVTGLGSALHGSTRVELVDSCSGFGLRLTLYSLKGPTAPASVRLDRNAFDQLMLDAAVTAGAEYRPGVSVESVTGVAGETTVTCTSASGVSTLTGRFAIDGSGKSAVIAHTQGTWEGGQSLDPRQAVFSHFVLDGPHRLVDPKGMTLIALDGGYAFVIPVGEQRVSVGVVAGAERSAPYGRELERLFHESVAQDPALAQMLAGARQVLPFIPALNQEFLCSRTAGDWFAVAGDAAGFLDPFFSTGVDLALATGVHAAETAHRVLSATSAGAREEAAGAHRRFVESQQETARSGSYDGHWNVLAPLRPVLADPHLPALVPLLSLLSRPQECGRPQDAVRSLRNSFQHL